MIYFQALQICVSHHSHFYFMLFFCHFQVLKYISLINSYKKYLFNNTQLLCYWEEGVFRSIQYLVLAYWQ